ncbi:MAG: HupU protein [Gammaproteobacteria bacterium]|nr:HupU protein [Gammaproteobacteria bacterium]
MADQAQKLNLLWLQSGGCGGCSMSLLNAEAPDLFTALNSAGIHLLWHPSLSEHSGQEMRAILQSIVDAQIQLDILCLEGSVIQGPDGSGGFHRMSGDGRPMRDWIHRLAQQAEQVLAVGSCAAFGGITSAGGNPGEACGLQYDGAKPGGLLGEGFHSRSGLPVVNIAGCPTHPNWVVDTLLQIAQGEMNLTELDELNRPRSYADHLVHHGCLRNEYYEFKASAEKLSDLGCLMEHLGCLGTQAHADCNTRLWNGEGSCLRGGYACINCTAATFEEPGHSFNQTPKIAGIPIGLPTDMPKAWFVALASLSKAATPARLKQNAHSDHIQIAPGDRTKEKP